MTKKAWKRVFEGELIKLDEATLPQKFTDDAFLAATKAGDYLPRLQLMTAASNECKSGKFPINTRVQSTLRRNRRCPAGPGSGPGKVLIVALTNRYRSAPQNGGRILA